MMSSSDNTTALAENKVLILYILNQLNSINKQLHKRLSENTRQPLNVGLFNKTIIKLASNINHCLKLEEKRRLDSINEQKQFKDFKYIT